MATAKERRYAAEARLTSSKLFNTTHKRSVYSPEKRTVLMQCRVELSLAEEIAAYGNANNISPSDAQRMLWRIGLDAAKKEL